MEASKCGRVPGADYIAYMRAKGYDGMIVTDHFFNGNSCISEELPWEERVRLYTEGYEHAVKAAEGTGFSVFFGIEYNFEGDEFLLYGVNPEWLLCHPDIERCSRAEVYQAVHEEGGIMIHAHPFRERGYLSAIHLTPSVCDGIEVYNSGNKDYQNALAARYAKERSFRVTAGSDIHYFEQDAHLHVHSVGYREGNRNLFAMGGMEFPEKLGSIREFVSAVMEGTGTAVEVVGQIRYPVSQVPELNETDRKPELPVIWHD